MIKNTFNNLSEEKRERIINAVIEEFTEHPTDKVSINKIIQKAEISRGSFYQYFDDKVDLIEVIAKTLFKNFYDKGKIILNESDGDIFLMYIKFFDLTADISANKEKKAIIKNLLSSLKTNDDLVSEYIHNRIKPPIVRENIFNYVDRSVLAFSSEFDVECLLEILNQLFKNAMFDLFVMEVDCNVIKNSFARKIEIIKAGALK
ncbi:MAG: TetR family transcriptional regulator [Ruminococcus sp.]|nr:TetR family transcriptional regulator [Ruminococcus sp.]